VGRSRQRGFDGSGGTPFFFPVRGGAFQFERLVIVDAFGQVLDLLAANANEVQADAATFFPIRARASARTAGSPATRGC
jgi:hypothetical protein